MYSTMDQLTPVVNKHNGIIYRCDCILTKRANKGNACVFVDREEEGVEIILSGLHGSQSSRPLYVYASTTSLQTKS